MLPLSCDFIVSRKNVLAYVTHLRGETVEKCDESLAVSLDNSKAFHRVRHNSLLNKLTELSLVAYGEMIF